MDFLNLVDLRGRPSSGFDLFRCLPIGGHAANGAPRMLLPPKFEKKAKVTSHYEKLHILETRRRVGFPSCALVAVNGKVERTK